jgi:rSAM/selenodomain-associated transferase 1
LRAATPTRAEVALLVFAKAPQPGRVKTRLVPLLGERGAARLHARLAERAVRTAVAAGLGPVELFCAPHARHPFFAALGRRYRVRLRAQGAGDLGERMYREFARVLRRADAALLTGSDCPALRAADLRTAARALKRGADAVLAPAEDGGYALIGLRRARKSLFRGVDWGSERVMRQTRARLERLCCKWVELRTVWDVDRPEDVARLRRSGLLRRVP